MLDNDILCHLPCRDGKLFRKLRGFPYDDWSVRFRHMLDNGTIGYEGPTVVRLTIDGIGTPAPSDRPKYQHRRSRGK